MSETQENELDKLSRKIIRNAGLETPPERLKENIMQAVAHQTIYSTQKSLLSKEVKIAVGVFVIGFFVLIGFVPQSNWSLELNEISGIMDHISAHIPKTFLYGILAFGLLVFIQIGYLRHRINQS